MACFARGDFFWGAGDDDLPACRASFWAKVDHPVGRFDDVQIVFDDEHRVALVDEPVEHGQKLADVVGVEARGWLVEDVERRLAGGPARRPAQLGRQLDSLRLATREGCRRLAD